VSRSSYDKKLIVLWGVWSLLLAFSVWVFWPALSGPFIFDDFGSLSRLGDLGGVRDWRTFYEFVFTGKTGPTGRPLSLLTFLVDGRNWPADPWPFKRTNLVLHLLCATLLLVASLKVLSVHNKLIPLTSRHYWVAFFVGGVWLLHPFLISTTFYVVQRMAQLATLFCLLGIVGYLYGRLMISSKPIQAYIVMSLSIACCTFLSMISKENGVLLPILIWMLEITLFASRISESGRLNKVWYFCFFILPAILVVGYLSKVFWSGLFFEQISTRGFSPYERLLTEARILFEYVGHWIYPKLYTSGLFHDGYKKSISIIEPWITVAAITGHSVLFFSALWNRRKWPLISFPILFFYIAHLVESTVVGLELYFEHRNYLAVCFLFLPVFYYLSCALSTVVFRAGAISIIIILSVFSQYSASIWSSYPSMVLSWSQKALYSSRAQQQASLELFNKGRYDAALTLLTASVERMPMDLELRVWKLVLSCHLSQVNSEDLKVANRLAERSLYDLRSIKLYRLFVETLARKECNELSLSDGENLFNSMMEYGSNAERSSAQYAHIQYLMGDILTYQDKPIEALRHYHRSLDARSGAGAAMSMAAFLATKGFGEQAYELSERAQKYIGAKEQQGGGILRSDIVSFQQQLLNDGSLLSRPK